MHGGHYSYHGGHNSYGHHSHRNNMKMGMSSSNPSTIRCCDPYNQKIYDVPTYMVEETQGKHTFTSNPTGRRAQICMRYQDGMCNMKQKCQQIHADRAWVKELRSRFFDSKKTYVSDIIACDPDSGETLAFKYSEVDTCLAKDKYRSMAERSRGLFWVCKEYITPQGCSQGRQCPHLHVPADKYARVLAATHEKHNRTPDQMSPGVAASPHTSVPMSPMSAMSQSWGDLEVAPSPTNYITPPQTPPTAFHQGPPGQYVNHRHGGYHNSAWERQNQYGPVSPLSVESDVYNAYDGYNSSNMTPTSNPYAHHQSCNDILYPSLEEQYSMHQKQQQAQAQPQSRSRTAHRAIKIEHPNATKCMITAPGARSVDSGAETPTSYDAKDVIGESLKSGTSTPNSRSHSCPPMSRKSSSYFSLDCEDDSEEEEEVVVLERSTGRHHRSRSTEPVRRTAALH